METCRDCGQRSLDYLGELKDKQTLGHAELGDVRRALRGVLQLAQVGDGAQHTHLLTGTGGVGYLLVLVLPKGKIKAERCCFHLSRWDVCSQPSGCTSMYSFCLEKKKSNHGFPHCPELKSEILCWSEHFGVACPPYPQALVLSLSHLSFRAPRPLLVVQGDSHPQLC